MLGGQPGRVAVSQAKGESVLRWRRTQLVKWCLEVTNRENSVHFRILQTTGALEQADVTQQSGLDKSSHGAGGREAIRPASLPTRREAPVRPLVGSLFLPSPPQTQHVCGFETCVQNDPVALNI